MACKMLFLSLPTGFRGFLAEIWTCACIIHAVENRLFTDRQSTCANARPHLSRKCDSGQIACIMHAQPRFSVIFSRKRVFWAANRSYSLTKACISVDSRHKPSQPVMPWHRFAQMYGFCRVFLFCTVACIHTISSDLRFYATFHSMLVYSSAKNHTFG